MIPFLSAFQYLLDLLPSVLDDDRFEIGDIERIGYDSYLVNMWIAFESIDGVLHDHFSRYLEELLGSGPVSYTHLPPVPLRHCRSR